MGTPRLPVHAPEAKRASERHARRSAHAAAFLQATSRITRHLVAEIGKPGVRLLEEIADGAKRGPAEVLEQVIDVARDHKPEADAIAPIVVLARRLGYALAAARQIEPGRMTLVGCLEGIVLEAADVVRAARAADDDQRIDAAELTDIRRQCQELRAAADAVEIAAEKAAISPLAPTLFAGGRS